MNLDTARTVEKVLKDGYYFDHLTLGEGGWECLYGHGIKSWKRYTLVTNFGHFKITAKDDQSAIAGFEHQWQLDGETWEISEVHTIHRLVASSDQAKKDLPTRKLRKAWSK